MRIFGREFETWPPESVEYQAWYVASAGAANGSAGGGRESDIFVFNPDDPVPTTGGSNSHFFPRNVGSKDQREVEKREDVLVYTSEPLSEELLIVGPLKAVLFVGREGRDTDFTAKLVVVRPDGYARNIEDGIIRIRHRTGNGFGHGVLNGETDVYHSQARPSHVLVPVLRLQ